MYFFLGKADICSDLRLLKHVFVDVLWLGLIDWYGICFYDNLILIAGQIFGLFGVNIWITISFDGKILFHV